MKEIKYCVIIRKKLGNNYNHTYNKRGKLRRHLRVIFKMIKLMNLPVNI
jgi:hypothetical protein